MNNIIKANNEENISFGYFYLLLEKIEYSTLQL